MRSLGLSHQQIEKILDQTNGSFTQADTCTCDECGDYFHQDELEYSEPEDEHLCPDCREYIDVGRSYFVYETREAYMRAKRYAWNNRTLR